MGVCWLRSLFEHLLNFCILCDIMSLKCKACQYSDDASTVASSVKLGWCFRVCWKQEHVCGEFCDQCLPGFYNLRADNPAGCDPCFCFEISDQCTGSTWGRDTVPHSTSTVSLWFCVRAVEFVNYLTRVLLDILTSYIYTGSYIYVPKYFQSYAVSELSKLFHPRATWTGL